VSVNHAIKTCVLRPLCHGLVAFLWWTSACTAIPRPWSLAPLSLAGCSEPCQVGGALWPWQYTRTCMHSLCVTYTKCGTLRWHDNQPQHIRRIVAEWTVDIELWWYDCQGWLSDCDKWSIRAQWKIPIVSSSDKSLEKELSSSVHSIRSYDGKANGNYTALTHGVS